MTVVRSRSQVLGLEQDFYQKNDIHLHMPKGDAQGWSECRRGHVYRVVSALTRIAVKSDVAMTGEITLRGEVLPIGGLKEKLLAAHRGGIKTVLIPDENVKDLAEIPDNIKGNLNIKPVKWIDEVLQIALVSQPVPLVVTTPAPRLKPSRRAVPRAAVSSRRRPTSSEALRRRHFRHGCTLLDTERVAQEAFFAACDELGITPRRDLLLRCVGAAEPMARQVIRRASAHARLRCVLPGLEPALRAAQSRHPVP